MTPHSLNLTWRSLPRMQSLFTIFPKASQASKNCPQGFNMKAELQEVMNMLRKLQGAIDFGNAPMAEREELAGDVTDIMDALFEAMRKIPDE